MNKKALILEAIKNSKKELNFLMHHLVKYWQTQKMKNEKSKMEPSSVHGLSKLITFYFTKFYREQYKIKCFSSIAFHQESILRKNFFLIPKVANVVKN